MIQITILTVQNYVHMLEEKLMEGVVHKQWQGQEASKTSERIERYSTQNSSIYTPNSFNR